MKKLTLLLLLTLSIIGAQAQTTYKLSSWQIMQYGLLNGTTQHTTYGKATFLDSVRIGSNFSRNSNYKLYVSTPQASNGVAFERRLTPGAGLGRGMEIMWAPHSGTGMQIGDGVGFIYSGYDAAGTYTTHSSWEAPVQSVTANMMKGSLQAWFADGTNLKANPAIQTDHMPYSIMYPKYRDAGTPYIFYGTPTLDGFYKSASYGVKDSSVIFIDDNNYRVGLNNLNPSVELDVTGRGSFTRSAFNYVESNSLTSDSWFRLSYNSAKKWDIKNKSDESDILKWVNASEANVMTLTQAGALNVSGSVTSSFVGSLTGNASTATLATNATTLANSRTIFGQSFDGSANVSGAISGATTIDASSNLTVGGTGSFTGNITANASLVFPDNGNGAFQIGRDATTPGFYIFNGGTGSYPLTINKTTNAVTTTAGLTVPSLKITSGASNGYVLKSDASGNASWQATTSAYKGTWDASTNTPTVEDGVGTTGDYYEVSTGGTQFGRSFTTGGRAIYNGTIWEPVGVSASVTSVNGYTGTVVLAKSDIGLGNADNTSDVNKPVSTTQQTALDLKANIASPTFTGTVVLPSTTSIGSVSNTEIGYVDGVTSAIQTQIDSKLSTSTAASTYAAKSGDTFTGEVTITGSGNGITLDNTVDGKIYNVGSEVRIAKTDGTNAVGIDLTTGNLSAYGNVTGANLSGTNTGDQTWLTLPGKPTIPTTTSELTNNSGFITGNQSITLSGAVTGSGATAITTTLASGIDATKLADGTVTSTELQHINSLTSNAQTQLDAKAPLASPTLTGTPTAPTASVGTNTTQLATTAFVQANKGTVDRLIGSSSVPTIVAGVGAGTGNTVSITGTDLAGKITITSGSSPTSGAIATITFNGAYSTTPFVVTQAGNATTADRSIYATPTTTTFEIGNSLGATLTPSEVYVWYYQVIQ